MILLIDYSPGLKHNFPLIRTHFDISTNRLFLQLQCGEKFRSRLAYCELTTHDSNGVTHRDQMWTHLIPVEI